MGSERRAIWTGDGSPQVLWWCLMLLAAVQWDHVVGNTEVDALHVLKEALNDPYHVLQSWDPTDRTPCTWFHVTCNNHSNVIRVDLGNATLSGILVPQLGELTNLQYLEMGSNNLTGLIPDSLGSLSQLVSLDLYQNDFTGQIPPLGGLSQLEFLRLNNNSLTGSIPLSLTGLDHLQVLDLSYNDLIGAIPVTGVFANFTYASFEGNPGLFYPGAPGPAPSAPVPFPGV